MARVSQAAFFVSGASLYVGACAVLIKDGAQCNEAFLKRQNNACLTGASPEKWLVTVKTAKAAAARSDTLRCAIPTFYAS